MKGEDSKITEIFDGQTKLVVPFYQRSYVWGEANWERLYDDLLNVCENKKDHFMGSVILKKTENGDMMIVDGQQRLTTMLLLLKQVCKRTVFEKSYMVLDSNDESIPILKHGLCDRNAFEYLMIEQDEIDKYKESGITRCYAYFKERLEKESLDYSELKEHLVFVKITLNKDEDEQTIFDTINSLGVRLTTGELLKNYFFGENDEEKYREKWVPMFENDDVQTYWNKDIYAGGRKKANVDVFFSSYLKIKVALSNVTRKSQYIKDEGLFGNYKEFIKECGLSKSDVLDEVLEYAKVYKRNLFLDSDSIDGRGRVRRLDFIIQNVGMTTVVPYILYVLKCVEDASKREELFAYLEAYMMRRVICKRKSNGLNKVVNEIFFT